MLTSLKGENKTHTESRSAEKTFPAGDPNKESADVVRIERCCLWSWNNPPHQVQIAAHLVVVWSPRVLTHSSANAYNRVILFQPLCLQS